MVEILEKSDDSISLRSKKWRLNIKPLDQFNNWFVDLVVITLGEGVLFFRGHVECHLYSASKSSSSSASKSSKC